MLYHSWSYDACLAQGVQHLTDVVLPPIAEAICPPAGGSALRVATVLRDGNPWGIVYHRVSYTPVLL